MRIAEVAKEMGMDPKKDLKIHTLLLGSELMTAACLLYTSSCV